MILVDTSVWIVHLRDVEPHLQSLLESRRVLCHPFVIGEVALGNLRQRAMVLRELARLPRAVVASDVEVLAMIDPCKLAGRDMGYVDAHILAAARLSGGRLWTRDKRLAAVAAEVGAHYGAA